MDPCVVSGDTHSNGKNGRGRGVPGAHLTCRTRLRSPATQVCYSGEFQNRSARHAPPPPAFVGVCASPNSAWWSIMGAGSQNRCVGRRHT
jgi:hypothetical protein